MSPEKTIGKHRIGGAEAVHLLEKSTREGAFLSEE